MLQKKPFLTSSLHLVLLIYCVTLCLALKYDWGDKAISWLLSLGADISDIPANEATAYLDRWD